MRYILIVAFSMLSFLCRAESSLEVNHHDHEIHAQHEDHDAHHHDAHSHGVAELTLVVEGGAVEIQLESPAANIVGFEHRARSVEQIASVETARSMLESSRQVFTLLGGECTVQQVSVDLSAITHRSGESALNDQSLVDTKHSEVMARYRYDCRQPEALKVVTVHLMGGFPSIETLNVQWVSAARQGAVDITAQSNRIIIE